MANSNKSILAYCSITESKTVTSPASGGGSNTIATINNYHFKSSSVYKSPGVLDATGILHIAPSTWTGAEPLISLSQMIGSGKLVRLYASVQPEDTAKPLKRVAILLTPDKVETAKGSGADGLVGKVLKTYRGTTEKTLGTVVRLGAKVNDHFQ
jgi:hypothetical protein